MNLIGKDKGTTYMRTRMCFDRIRSNELKHKVMTVEQAVGFIKNGMIVAANGFTPSGYSEAVPMALVEKAKKRKSAI
ncbi:MAG: hypothetical protein J7L96_03645 [Bacteroidales bacterium]|nr:hypothetical protein [Bacteroidales bacterium]